MAGSRTLILASLLVATVAIGTTSAEGQASPTAADPGETTSGAVTSGGLEYPYIRYTPSSYRSGDAVPLVVVVHGCGTTAQQQMEISRFNQLAEREGFVVLYPEGDPIGRNLPAPLHQCWKFFDPTAYFRGNSDPAAIAAMTRRVMAERAIDPERVYLVGVSAGGLMASSSAANYPELYTAVGIVVSAGYADALCFTTGIGIPVEVGALLGYTQMGARARVVPTIGIGSDADLAFPAVCTRKAVEQSLRINNLVLGGSQTAPLALTPAEVSEGEVPDGLGYTVSTFRDPDGCVVAEQWIVHGMPHAWPGGADYGGYSDTRAPDGAEATWAFLSRFRKSDTSLPCAESTPSAPQPLSPVPSGTPDTSSSPTATPPPHQLASEGLAGARLAATGGHSPLAPSLVLAVFGLSVGLALRAAHRRGQAPIG